MRSGASARRFRAIVSLGVLTIPLMLPGCSDTDGDARACVLPTLTLTADEPAGSGSGPVAAPVGGVVRASGSRFYVGCVEAGSEGDPLQGIRLFVVQGDQRTSVARVNASGDDRSFSIPFGVPQTLAAGTARLEALAPADDPTPLAVAEFSVLPA